MHKFLLSFLCVLWVSVFAFSQEQHEGQEHGAETHAEQSENHGDGHGHGNECGYYEEDVFNPGKVSFHHISDQNIYSIGPWHFPLPCIMYVSGEGLDFFSSGVFKADYHGTGEYAYNGWVIYEGSVRRIVDQSFPKGKIELGPHKVYPVIEEVNGKKKDIINVCFEGKAWVADSKSYADGGLFGGGVSSFYDFSITKNVVSMILVFVFLAWAFIGSARAYENRAGLAPKGMQSFLESIFVFIQDEVAKPFLGPQWEKYLPFIMSLFFFVLGLNLFGQVPFFGGSNVTGNISFTLIIALLAFIVTNINGNKHYWEHVFWMPGIPAWVKVIVTPVEFIGLFVKPLTLMLRLFGNITAGHMVIVIFVGLIFIFGQNGANAVAGWATSIGSIVLTIFMMSIELLVAFIQAFVFAILTASYIGAAIEEGHGEEAH